MEISQVLLPILNALKMIYLPSDLNFKILEIKVAFPFSVYLLLLLFFLGREVSLSYR